MRDSLSFQFEIAEIKFKDLTKLERGIRLLKLFQSTNDYLLGCKLFIKLDSCENVWAPSVRLVNRNIANLKLRLDSHEIILSSDLTFIGAGIVDPEGYLIRFSGYTHPVICDTEDTLKVDYTLQVHF